MGVLVKLENDSVPKYSWLCYVYIFSEIIPISGLIGGAKS